MAAKKQRSLVWSWALYDWANSAFATTVMAVFFPLFFKKYWASDLSVIESTAMLAYANSLSSIFLALTSPIFGAIADEGAYLRIVVDDEDVRRDLQHGHTARARQLIAQTRRTKGRWRRDMACWPP